MSFGVLVICMNVIWLLGMLVIVFGELLSDSVWKLLSVRLRCGLFIVFMSFYVWLYCFMMWFYVSVLYVVIMLVCCVVLVSMLSWLMSSLLFVIVLVVILL